MPYGVYMSAAGAQAQSHRLQVLSNNLANVETPGFKPQQAVLQARFAEMIERGVVPAGLGGADDVGGGITIQEAATQFGVGSIRQTGNPTDFALNDPAAFFVVQRDGQQALTRAGDFHVDATGRLVSAAGDPVLGSDGQPIRLNPAFPYQVLDGGRIQQGQEVRELMLARPKSLGDISHLGGNLFKPLADFDLAAADQRPVVSGFLESSAVRPTTAMMELIEASRAYEANVRMIQNQDHMMGQLISRVLQR